MNNNINITSVRVRKVNSNNLLAIASITLNDDLIINDIKVILANGKIIIRFPNSEYAEKNNQSNIIVKGKLLKQIKNEVIEKINKA